MSLHDTRLHGIGLLSIVALALAATPARAQSAQAWAQVSRRCAAETARLCPSIDPAVPQPHTQAICLRSYRASLSPPCRRAVGAVFR